jgi:hypothetical protein
MKNEMARYTFNYYEGNHRVPLFETSLKNVYRISTNFDDEKRLIAFIKEHFKIDSSIEKVIVTYNESKAHSSDILYSNARDIILNNLPDRIIEYISHHSYLTYLHIENITNSFLRTKLTELMGSGSEKSAESFRTINRLRTLLESSYKTACDLANFINDHMKGAFLSTSPKQEHSYEEISEMVKNMNIRVFKETQSTYNNPKVDAIITGFREIMTNQTMSAEERAKREAAIYDDEELRPLYPPLTFEPEEKGKSR